jgi:hypothetical protein
MAANEKVPSTITDAQWRSLAERARKSDPKMFTKAAITRRQAAAEQQRKANQS